MPESTRDGQQRVALFARDDLPPVVTHRLAGLSARLEQLVADAVIDSYMVHRWSKRQPIDSVEATQQSRYASFREWARTSGVRLTPGFQTRECYSMQTGDRQRSRVFPVVCLAVYDGDELDAVYPHVGTEPRTVEDGLDTLSSATGESTVSTGAGSSVAD